MTKDTPTPTAPGPAIIQAIARLSAAMRAAGLPEPVAIVVQDRPTLFRFEAVLKSGVVGMVEDPALRGKATTVLGVEIRSDRP